MVTVSLLAGCGDEMSGDDDDVQHNTGGDPPWSHSADAGAGGPGFGFGVTLGGAKDIRFAREQIQAGQVPRGDAILVEGLLSEHDIPVDGEPCQSMFCLRPALGVAPSLETGQQEYFIQLGLISGLDRATFVRPPLDLVVVIDRSASMAVDQTETNHAVTRIVDQMRPDDRLSVLAFNDDVDVLYPLGAVTDKAALNTTVRALRSQGGWQLLSALTSAYRILDAAGDDQTRLRRVIVLSCGYPQLSSGATDPHRVLIEDGATRRIGLSFFGVLLGWSPEVAQLLGRVRGGSYHYLSGLEDVKQAFDVDFDTMMTPILYGLDLSFQVGDRFEVVRLYGIPGDPGEPAPTPSPTPTPTPTPTPDPTTASTGTGFLSNRRGAMVARLRLRPDATGQGSLGTIKLAYEPEPALGLGSGRIEVLAEVQDFNATPDGPQYQSLGVRKSVALVTQAVEMRAACDAYHAGDKARAAVILTRLRTHLIAESAALATTDLAAEIALVERLLANVQ